jgi:hypothetical protein
VKEPRCLIAALLAVGLMVAACGDDDAAERAGFTEEDLPRLVLGPSEGPPHTKVSDGSGRDLLEREGGLERLLYQLREEGFVADHGIQFEPMRRDGPFVEALALVFTDEDAAGRGFDLLLRFHLNFYASAEETPTKGLGEDSWGVRGMFDRRFHSGIFALRTGNLIQVATVTGGPARQLNQAREVAVQLEELARE